jgi:hypothetical protein
MTMIDFDTIAIQQPTAHKTPKKHWGLIAVVAALVLAFLALGAFGFHEHQVLGKSQAHAASVSSQLTDTKQDLSKAHDSITGLKAANATLTETARKCSVYPAISNHFLKAIGFELKAIQDGMFGSIIWLPKATDEIHKSMHLMKSHQAFNGELDSLCGPSKTSTT